MDRKIRSGSILLSLPKGYVWGQAIVSLWSQHHNPPTRAEPLWFLLIYYPAYSTFSPVAMESRRVTIVQYDLLSREDEKDSDQTYVYLSSKLSPLSASEFLFEPPAEEDQSDHSEQNSILVLESDSASDEAGPSTSASKMNTPVRQCVKWLGNLPNNPDAAAPIYVVSSSESEEQDNEFSRLPLLPDGASSDFEIIASTSAGASIYVSLSSESQDQDGKASKWPRLSDVASSDSEIMPSTAAGAPIYVSSSSEWDDEDSGALVPETSRATGKPERTPCRGLCLLHKFTPTGESRKARVPCHLRKSPGADLVWVLSVYFFKIRVVWPV